jgi:hypothetical protein
MERGERPNIVTRDEAASPDHGLSFDSERESVVLEAAMRHPLAGSPSHADRLSRRT